MTNTATLAFEIGTEEIPAFDLKRATEQLAELVPAALDAVRIPHGEVSIYTTPRRLVAVVADVCAQTEALEEVFRGPAASIAFDEEGNPTKAAIGFARGKGLDVDALERRDENGVEYVYAVRNVPAQAVAALLPEVLAGVIDGISWPKSCRWGTTSEMFSRPVRWMVALLGDTVIPVEYAGLVAGNETRGHRFLAPGPHKVASADELLPVICGAYVVPTQEAREQVIREGVAAIEAATGCTADLPAKTLTEVINLSEYPTPMMGTFDAEFLKVPEEIIVDAMLMHQRYFPLYDADGKLTNQFIIVSNGDPAHSATIVDGNERVVAARLYDAKFFYDEDLKIPLADFVDRLDEVVFQEALGTMRDKTARVVKLSARITAAAGIEAAEMRDIARAAYLAKADLVTGAVVEFTSVQGIMGSYYATAAGEPERVARAIAEHYRPRFSGDAIPTDVIGQVVALSDKIDTICGLFAVGQAPTGSSDPFALRRAALGVLAILEETGLPISLVETIDAALIIYREAGLEFDNAAVRREIIDFFITREKVALRDAGVKADTIDAVLACGIEEPMVLAARARALEAARTHDPEVFADLATAFARANNLREIGLGTGYKTAELSDVERVLSDAVEGAEEAVAGALREDRFADALVALAALRAPVDTFFETTMVMDDDPEVRANRLKLLNRFANVFAHVADFGQMAKR
ncbi:glycine--tRNA ligase subunit beta [Adlercreutzia sp. R21]|uniref:glycine--tRNA ligase subunit beta n=1 Tax=Adlercreutzia wanghongyangiae TaxID=3111451 RepID=UPI002DBB2CD9|nr:glycine--tRNA ligase subunit beta [Adlercreutzia sp. R21]MEC4183694.1 glycine--tRNA ligase subunit beta [Adlercreutzia sp. R21]